MKNNIKKFFDSAATSLGLKFKPNAGEELVIAMINKALSYKDTVILINADVCYLCVNSNHDGQEQDKDNTMTYILVSATNAKVIGQHNIITKRLTNEAALYIHNELISAERNRRIREIASIMEEKENNFLAKLNETL